MERIISLLYRKAIATGSYSHVVTSPEIALAMNFNMDILDKLETTDKLRLMTIDEKNTFSRGKKFRPLYAKIYERQKWARESLLEQVEGYQRKGAITSRHPSQLQWMLDVSETAVSYLVSEKWQFSAS